MADRVLRDHSQPCGDPLDEGGRYQYTDGTWGCDAMGCPGGREVIDEQIGWFNPGSKRFCYSDEKVVDAEHLGYPNKESYTEPVFIWKSV